MKLVRKAAIYWKTLSEEEKYDYARRAQ